MNSYDYIAVVESEDHTINYAKLPKGCSGLMFTIQAKSAEDARNKISYEIRQWAAKHGIIIKLMTLFDVTRRE